MNNIYSKRELHPLCFVLTRLAIYISIALKLFSKKNDNLRELQNYR